MNMILDKPIIFAIVGNSGSGKTTAANYVSRKLGIPVLSSYTTRPMRAGEKDGVEHIFTTEDQMPSRNEMIAYTYFGQHHYWATRSQVDGQGAILYVIDEAGLEELLDRFEKIYYIVPIYVKCDNMPWMKKDKRRTMRDAQRIPLPQSYYRVVVENNETIEEFLKQFLWVIKRLLEVDPEKAIAEWCRKQCGLPTSSELNKIWKGYDSGYLCS